jgi:hypothetical protein
MDPSFVKRDPSKNYFGRVKTLQNLANNGQIINRQAIWDERRIELCFEFDRFYDLIRTNQAFYAFYLWNNLEAGEGVYLKEFQKGVNEIFPIPLDEIKKSAGKWIQNPGY